MTTADEVFEELRASFRHENPRNRRRFLPGLLVSMMGVIRALDAANGRYASLDAFYADHPRTEVTGSGGRANAWAVVVTPADPVAKKKAKTLSIRPFYEKFVRWIRIENRRLDYPKAAPHATQAWVDYVHWLECLIGLSEADMLALEERTKAFVLAELPEHVRNSSAQRREPLLFSRFLDEFDFSHKPRETSGAAYQGTVFGYVRADAAHLQVETASVRTGGKREKRVGDIDALNGASLVIAAEVKQSVVGAADVPEFEELATQVSNEGALGLVVALDFASGARECLTQMGLHPVSRKDLSERVKLWDALKQRVAVDALIYYVTRIEHNTPLRDRVNAFFSSIEAECPDASGASAIGEDVAMTGPDGTTGPAGPQNPSSSTTG